MSEPEVKKKNKKKKKKSGKKTTVEEIPVPPTPPSSENKISQNDSENGTVSINEVLPNKVGMTTKFNDVEVTMTHDGIVNNTNTSTSSKKKKKKKKKSKQEATEVVEESKTTEDNSETNFFKFDKDHIELVNHPEISVTLSKTVPVKEKETQKSEKENPSAFDKKDQQPEVTANSSSKKKKKKKKKKKTAEDSNISPEQTNPESADSSYKAPTYVKLPAAGDSCVLVVSHESFAGDNKAPVNSEKGTTANSNSTVLIKSKDRIEEPKGFALLAPKVQAEPSISIFPLSSDQNKTPADKSSSVTMESSLQKVSELIKKEVDSNDPAKDEPANSEGPALTKAQLKAERRAKQEAQRAAKLAKNNEKNASHTEAAAQKKISTENSKPSPQVKQNVAENTEATKPKSASKPSSEKCTLGRGSQIFSHLRQVKNLTPKQMRDANLKIHPAIIELGVHFNKGSICGSNARCVGFLGAFREVIKDYERPSNKEFSRDLESKLKIYLNFLNTCRPLSVSITNTVRFLQHQMNRIPKDCSDEEAKQRLYNSINNFVKEEILLAKEAICMSATAKIVDGDNIVVYAYSSIVKDVLCKAHDQNKSFHVTVIDSGPKFEGLQMLHLLSEHGLQCAYKSIDSVCSVMKKASKVFIGAHALLLNGYVMSRLGCKQLALVASSYSVPVLVCCETYKFCDRSLSDSFVHNELGRPEDLIKTCLNKSESFEEWLSLPSFQACNILYDVTPSDLISVIITEKGLLPCSSVPVVLRVKYASLQE